MAFDVASLQLAVSRALAETSVPAGHSNAFALVATTDGRVQAVLSQKISDVWVIESVLSVSPGAGVEGGVMVKATW